MPNKKYSNEIKLIRDKYSDKINNDIRELIDNYIEADYSSSRVLLEKMFEIRTGINERVAKDFIAATNKEIDFNDDFNAWWDRVYFLGKSITNSNKSNTGADFEKFIARILDLLNIDYSEQVKSEISGIIDFEIKNKKIYISAKWNTRERYKQTIQEKEKNPDYEVVLVHNEEKLEDEKKRHLADSGVITHSLYSENGFSSFLEYLENI